MSKKNILICLIYVGLVLISTISCAKVTAVNTATETSPASTDSKPKITIIRFASEIYPPFTTLDTNQKLEGFDIDIAQALCKKINAQCTFSKDQFENMVSSLQTKKYDAWISAITISDKHKKDTFLTDPYFSSTAQLIATKATVFNAAPIEIKGKTIGVVERGRYLRFLRKTYGENTIKIKIFSSRDAAFAALNDGSIDAVIDDAMVIKSWRLYQSNYKKYRLIDLPAKYSELVWHRYGIAIAKDNIELVKALNDAILQIKTDGTHAQLIKKYFAE